MQRHGSWVLVLAVFAFCTGAYGQTTSITVRDRVGRPIAAAEIEILAGDDVVADTTSGKEGTVGLALDAGSYRARVTAPGHVIGLSRPFKTSTATASTIEVALFPGSAVAAIVQDDKGKPVPGAKVCLELHDRKQFPPSAFGENLLVDGQECVESDARGQVVTEVLPVGTYDLSIETDALMPRKMTLELEVDLAAQIWRLQRGGRIVGRVEDQEEQPVEAAIVRLRHRELEVEQQGLTDAEGRFAVAGLSPGPWSVRVEPPNAAVILRDGVLVQEGVAVDLGILRVRPGLDIEGLVVDENGKPVSGVQIKVRTADRARRLLRTVTGDDDGRFLVSGLDDDPVHLLVDAPDGHASAALADVEPPRRDLEIELSETGTVCGEVRDEEGEVPAGVSATALPSGLGLLDMYRQIVWSTTRDVDPEIGAFCLQDVYPGPRVKVSSAAPGYLDASTVVEIIPGQEAAPVELTLKRGLSLEGTVVGPDGQPLAEAAVRRQRGAMVFTDSFGEFRLDGLRAGMVNVVATHANHAPAERDVMLPLGEEESLVIELRAGGTIEGTVRRSNGDPVEDVPIGLSTSRDLERTDNDGRFRFEHVPAGECTVTRRSREHHDDFEHRDIEVEEDAVVQVEFTLGAVLEGQVLRGGVPVPGVSIVLARPNDVTQYTGSAHAVQRTFSDETGAYRLAGVRPGWGTVTLELGRETVVRQIEVPAGDQPRSDLFLPERKISGVVLNAADESGIGGARVSATLAASAGAPQSGGSSSYSSNDDRGGISYNLTSHAEARTPTDATGNFEIFVDALPQVTVHAWATGFRGPAVEVSPSDAAPVEIRLARETRLVVKLRDAQDRPVFGANVCALQVAGGGGRSSSCTMGGTDQAKFSLNEGRYKIQATAAGFGTRVLEHDLKQREDGSAHTIVAHLVPGAPLNIRLVGLAVEGARVAALIDPAGVDQVDLVQEGGIDAATGDRRWSTWSLDPGLWTVSVDPGTGEPLVREVQVIAGGPIEVVLP